MRLGSRQWGSLVAVARFAWGAASLTEGNGAVAKSFVGTLLTTVLLIGACAPTNSTGTLPVEVLVVLDSTAAELVLIPVDSIQVRRSIPLDGLSFVPTVLDARGDVAVVAGRLPAAGAAVIDLSTGQVVSQLALLQGRIAAVQVTESGRAFVAVSTGSAVETIDLLTGGKVLLAVPGGPQGFAATRGKVFSVVGNRAGCESDPVGCVRGPSWLVQTEPTLPRDSIPLSGPGNAGPATVGADGFVYVLSAGDEFAGGEGRLSVIDPVGNVELAVFAGVGPVEPAWLASDGGNRILVASPAGGLLVFNTRERRFTLPFGSGIPLEFPTDMVTDALGRAYVLQRGGCSAGSGGRIRVFGTSLIEQQPIMGVQCPIAGAMAEVPAERIFESQP
jgi:DNA-binding beta-propeller fold protein YncE